LAGLLLGTVAAAQAPAAAEAKSVDRVLAVVDDDPILASDVERVAGLALDPRRPGEDDRGFRRRVLDGLIEQRLRFHEVEKFGFSEVPADAVDVQVAALRSQFPAAGAFERRLAALGMNLAALRQLLTRQILVLAYVDERVGPRVFVGLEDIRRYYESVLVPEAAKSAQEAPALEDVRERIRGVLREERLNEEIQRWTAQLRERAVIEDHFDRVAGELPPLRFELKAPAGKLAKPSGGERREPGQLPAYR
jgi:peptidyl-prolyl cis-trans isomerase SurA